MMRPRRKELEGSIGLSKRFSHRAPGSSGVKVQDIWFISCICFILLAITEYAACLYLKRNLTRKKREAKMKLAKEQAAKASKAEKEHLRQKEEQKLFVVRTFANNVVRAINKYQVPPTEEHEGVFTNS